MKERRFLRWSAVCLLALLYVNGAEAFDYSPGYTFVEVLRPLDGDNRTYPLIPRAVPAPGESFKDLRFGTDLTRATKRLGLRHDYSRFDAFNADGSMILLLYPPTGVWYVYRTSPVPFDAPANLVRTIDSLNELWWDTTKPNFIWGVRDFRIMKVDVAIGKKTLIKDFSRDAVIGPIIKAEGDLFRITDKDEGEPSVNKRFWAFALQGSKDDYRLRYLFTWDRKINKVLGLYKLSKAEAEVIDWVGMSPLGRWALIGGVSGNVKTAGLTMANRAFTAFHRLAHETAHSDVALDADGKEVVVMQNTRTDYVDLIPLDVTAKVVMSENDYKNNVIKPIVRLYYASESKIGFNGGIHISCNHAGYCVISTTMSPHTSEQNWLDRSMILAKLDGASSRVVYLAKIYNTTGSYWEETHASMTNDGSKVIWADNWNRNVNEEKCFVMMLTMPPNWEEQLN